jgi:hypothetical protein
MPLHLFHLIFNDLAPSIYKKNKLLFIINGAWSKVPTFYTYVTLDRFVLLTVV